MPQKKKMNKLIALTLVAFSLVLVNCKDKSGDDPEPTKTLNKSLITGKYWATKTPPLLSFYFGSGGILYLPDGKTTWALTIESFEISADFTSINKSPSGAFGLTGFVPFIDLI